MESKIEELKKKSLHKLTNFQPFETAEIAKFDEQERFEYEESLKYYRDLKNVIDTAFDDGKVDGIEIGEARGIEIGEARGKERQKIESIIKALKRGKLSIEEIAEDFEVNVEFIQKVKAKYEL